MTKLAVTNMPRIGDGATYNCGSDAYPFTIVDVSPDGRTIVVQPDNARRTDNNGYGGEQKYEYTPNPTADKVTYTLRRDGRYHRLGSLVKARNTMSLGGRCYYRDPSF